jgi:hypothetical protein
MAWPAPPLLAEDHAPAASGSHESASPGPADAQDEDLKRTDILDLGAFRVCSSQAADLAITDINFSLYLVLSSTSTAAGFHRLENWTQRLRDQVIIAVRSANPADLADPALRRLHRLILYRIKRLPTPVKIIGVYLTDFAVMESEDIAAQYVLPITPSAPAKKPAGGH